MLTAARNQGSFRSGVSKLEPLANPPTVKTLGQPLADDSDAAAPAGGTATSGSNVDGGGGSGEGKSGYGGIIQGSWARRNKKAQYQRLQSLNESSMSPGLEYVMEEEGGRRRRAYSVDGHELGVDGQKHARGENSSFQHSRYLRMSDSSIGGIVCEEVRYAYKNAIDYRIVVFGSCVPLFPRYLLETPEMVQQCLQRRRQPA